MIFDELIRAGDDVGALRVFADEYYKKRKMGGTRKALLDRIVERLSPKKAIRHHDGYVNCPICYNEVSDDLGDNTVTYCPWCGQALDWEVSE